MKSISAFLGSGLFFLIILSGCDPVFEPLNQNRPFLYSVNGVLDARPDTQWIRVMAIRDSVRYTPNPLDISVTLEHPASGTKVVMQDTLQSFFGNTETVVAQVFNYWSTMDLEPEETYRLTVTGPDGQTASSEVTLPKTFREPEFQGHDMRLPVEDFDHLVDVSAVHYYVNTVSGQKVRSVNPLLSQVRETFLGNYRIILGGRLGPKETYGGPWRRTKMELVIASGGPGWPPFSSMGELALQVPDAFTNIQNGTGFLAPVVTRTVPICAGEVYYPCPDGPEE